MRSLQQWLNAWSYSDAVGALHQSSEEIPDDHPYRYELLNLLDPAGHIRAHAVFDVDGLPTVCFFEDDERLMSDASVLNAVRQKIWNQNLISIVVTVEQESAQILPVSKKEYAAIKITHADAKPFGAYSRSDIQSGEIFIRHQDWFNAESRVDRILLENLKIVVKHLQTNGLDKLDAQLLIAQVMFVAYLEHREIVSDVYRQEHNVASLFDLISAKNRKGITALLNQLKSDFNGDLLAPESGAEQHWLNSPDSSLQIIHNFLQQVNLATGQGNLWNYDFRYIPVELISGIYESFLAEDKRDVGAYYTPRHLAMLVVDQALASSKDVLQEKIYDGACGSGILLTTAYRRLLGHAESKQRSQMDFSNRVKLLEDSIFGSDINVSACRVTAFSLYLCVLEGLEPRDIAILTKQNRAKLPSLLNGNLRAGNVEGDFFSNENPFAGSQRFTIFLSNPPWVEPKKSETLSSDKWATAKNIKIPRRQTAGAFLLHAYDSVCADATLCFILPVSILAAPTSKSFIQEILKNYRITKIINFGDLRKILFDKAKQPCFVLVAKPREIDQLRPSSDEQIEYWVPKADISLAFGRLTLHASDRHQIRAVNLAYDNEVLTTLFWGNAYDAATLARLRLHGTLGKVLKNRQGWDILKGFHKKDASAAIPVSSEPLKDIQFLDAKRFRIDGPLLDEDSLENFSVSKIPSIARLPDTLIEKFKAPKIVFTDGVTSDRKIWAAFSNIPFSFSSSIGAIVAPSEDEDLLKFLSVYLHSDIARYVLLLSAYQINFERERITLDDLKGFPFVAPEHHTNPELATSIVKRIVSDLKSIESENFLTKPQKYESFEITAKELLAQYFGLSTREVQRMSEVVSCVLPNLQPSSYKRLYTELQRRPTPVVMQNYAQNLLSELNDWRDTLHGKGNLRTLIAVGEQSTHASLGIIRLEITNEGQPLTDNEVTIKVENALVVEILSNLTTLGVLPMSLQKNLYLSADVVIHVGRAIYIIKPLLHRFWFNGEAPRDAERIVRSIQGQANNNG